MNVVLLFEGTNNLPTKNPEVDANPKKYCRKLYDDESKYNMSIEKVNASVPK